MSQTERGKAFDANEPNLDAPEMQAAYDKGSIAISLRGKPMLHESGIIQFLAVKFALVDGSFETILLDRMSASALRALIAAADKVNWDGNAMRPGGTSH